MNVIHDEYLARTLARTIIQGDDDFDLLARLDIEATPEDAGDGATHFLALREETLYEVTRSETSGDEVRVSPLTDLYFKIEHLIAQATTARSGRAELELGAELLHLQGENCGNRPLHREELASYIKVLREEVDFTTERAQA
jgi:hypothetical protein